MTHSDLARRIALGLALVGLGACSSPAKETTLLIQVTTSTLVVPDDVDELIIHVDGVESMTTLEERFRLAPFPQSYLVRAASHPNQAVTITVTALSATAVRIQRVVHSRFVEGTNSVVVVDLETSCLEVVCVAGYDCVDGVCEPGGVIDGGPRDLGPDDAGVDGGPCISTGAELCDGVDNDCNGTIDDGFDLQSDTQNCGRCGRVCGTLPNGNNTCVLGACTLMCDSGRDD